MKLIWTKNNLPLSVLIRWGLKEPVSHFAIVFDDKIAFHSNLAGCNVEWFSEFKKHSEVFLEIDKYLPIEIEEKVYQSIIDKNVEKTYDFGAFLYFLWRGILFRFFGKQIPKLNKWSNNNQLICTGLASELPKEHFPELEGVLDTEMLSPYQLYLKLKH